MGTYQLAVRLINFEGSYTLTINGFPVSRLPVMGTTAGQTVGANVQTGLIGKGNAASVRVEPYLTRWGDRLSCGLVRMRAWVQRDEGEKHIPGAAITSAEVDTAYAAWKKRVRAKWRGYVRREASSDDGRWALDSLGAWAERHPLTVTTTFDNEAGPDFSAIFEEASVIEGTPADSARLRRYALKLRDLMKAEDARGLAEAYYDDSEQRSATPSDSLRLQAEIARFKNDWFKYDFILDFDGADVVLRKWCRGRVWQMYPRRAPGEGFFRTGIAFSMGGELYVAEIDGELRVVR